MSEIELHRKLLGDAGRNQAFHAALKQHITPGVTTVADLGAGTGFLSFLARRLGAKHCHLIEYSEALALAQTLAPVSIRALSTAIFFFILNMIALGFGPTVAFDQGRE